MTTYKSKNQRYAEAYPSIQVLETPTFAEVWVRQNSGSYIDRVSILPELPADHPVRCNMEAWNFQLVARIFADSVSSIVFKGFYKSNKEGEAKADGTIFSNVFGEDIAQEDGEATRLNLFMFKAFTPMVSKDSKGNFIKDQDGKHVMVNVGHISSVATGIVEDKELTDRMLAYKTCAMPAMIIAKGLTKIQLLRAKDGKPRTISGDYIQKQRVSLDAYMAAQVSQPQVQEKYPDVVEAEVVSSSSFGASGTDDLPF